MTHGSLALHAGVLFVARHEQTAHVRPYDLEGRPLGPGFSFRGAHAEPCALGGIDVDEDRTIWIAQAAPAAVRAFNVFGRETSSFRGLATARDDARRALREPCDIAVSTDDDGHDLIVASGGTRRHAVQVFADDGRFVESLRPEGNPMARFHGVTRLAVRGRFVYVCEASAGRVQVFRDREFHFSFRVPVRRGGSFEPVAVAPLDDGRCIVLTGGADAALLLVDGAGRLQRVLAEHGSALGAVHDVGDVVVDPAASSASARIAVIDTDAERVQVLTLTGRVCGQLGELPGSAAGAAE
jgi:hypothetical protein